MNTKTCKVCGKETTMPFHTCSKPETKQEDLKPCPFCGCLPSKGVQVNENNINLLIKCPDCPCQMTFGSSTVEQAIEAWNRSSHILEPQSSYLTFNDGVTAMTRHSLAAVKLVESGRWTVVRMKEWLTACLTQDIKFLTDELKASSLPNPTTETNSGLDEIAEKIVIEMLEYSSMDFDEEQFIHNRRVTYVKDLIKQALLTATEQLRVIADEAVLGLAESIALKDKAYEERDQLRKENEELNRQLQNSPIRQIAEQQVRIHEAESALALAQQRLVKLAKAVVNDGTINEYGIAGYRFLSIEILSGNFETIDKQTQHNGGYCSAEHHKLHHSKLNA